jgi:organic radical activating enzyme
MSKLRICEMFGNSNQWAIQGEGMFAGVPSIFIRTFGCNLRCQFGDIGFKESNMLRMTACTYNSLEALPIAKTGCDTFYSIYPEFVHMTKEMTEEELLIELAHAIGGQHKISPHLVITGGEPLLPKWQLFYSTFIPTVVRMLNITNITFETNGTQELIPEFKSMLRLARNWFKVSFSISPKLNNSGHSSIETLKPEVVKWYELLGQDSWFKFVISPSTDIGEVEFFMRAYKSQLPVYLMPQGGTRDEYLENEPYVYNLCCKYGYRFSPRLQVTAANNSVGI